MLAVGPNTRLQVSPDCEAWIAQRATAFSPHNSVLTPVSYGDPDDEYDRLMNGVSQWAVSVQRHVDITGSCATYRSSKNLP